MTHATQKVAGASLAPKAVRSIMDTILITPELVERWKKPPFQRELRVTEKVRQFSDDLKGNGGIITGVITLGKLGPDTFLMDGQHRIEGFKMTGLHEAVTDVRICHFDTMADMGEEYIRLNSALVRMKNDDILKALEGTNNHLSAIRRRCPFVGYSHIRVGGSSKTMVSMANVIRLWFGTQGQTPTPGPSTMDAAKALDTENTNQLVEFLTSCYEAWGTDLENTKLWGTLNMGILMWVWRRVVLRPVDKSTKHVHMNREQFISCLMSLSASARYAEWLSGRGLRDRDRSPAYARIREIFTSKLANLGVSHPRFPQQAWSHS